MAVFLIRHTVTAVPKGICYGQTDVALAEDFQADFDRIKDAYPALKDIKTVYSSPLQRCSILARFLFPNEEVVFDKRLMELNFGKWELQAWDDLSKDELDPWMNDFVNVACPEGESYVALSRRVLEFWSNIDKSKDCAIVSHGGAIRAILAHEQGVSLKDSFSIKVDLGEVYVVAE